jgi:hypothetical protein
LTLGCTFDELIVLSPQEQQMRAPGFIELSPMALAGPDWVYAPISPAHGMGLLELLGNPNNTSL